MTPLWVARGNGTRTNHCSVPAGTPVLGQLCPLSPMGGGRRLPQGPWGLQNECLMPSPPATVRGSQPSSVRAVRSFHFLLPFWVRSSSLFHSTRPGAERELQKLTSAAVPSTDLCFCTKAHSFRRKRILSQFHPCEQKTDLEPD